MENLTNKEKLCILCNSLKDGFELSLFNFINDAVIIKDTNNHLMFKCDFIINDNKAFFINVVQKKDNYLIPTDL